MGLALTLLYIVVTYLSPQFLIPTLAVYRPVLWLVVLAFLCSVPYLPESLRRMSAAPQTYLILGFTAALSLSQLVHLWFGGILFALSTVGPSLVLYFLVVINARTTKHLAMIAFTLIACACITAANGIYAYYTRPLGAPQTMFLMPFPMWDAGVFLGYLPRITGAGFLNDPNDFSQFLLVVLPMIWVAWQQRNPARNLLIVILPSAFVLWAVILTHSRGALIALALVLLLAFHKRLGKFSSTILSGAALGVGTLLFSGGRSISMEQGADRLDSWSIGLELFKSSPLFGTGYGDFLNHNSITAHNSFVLCLAELGAMGLFCWVGMLVISTLQMRQVSGESAPPKRTADSTASGEIGLQRTGPRHMQPDRISLRYSHAETRMLEAGGVALAETPEAEAPIAPEEENPMAKWAKMIYFSIVFFVFTSWFLSRTYTPTPYLLAGMAVVIADDAGSLGVVEIRWARLTFGLSAGILLAVDLTVRLHWLVGG